jgi:predicted transcriptional regulator
MSKPRVNPKAFALDLLKQMPDDATLNDLKYEFDLIAGLIESIQDEEEGRVHTHEEVMEMLRQCRSNSAGQPAPAAT